MAGQKNIISDANAETIEAIAKAVAAQISWVGKRWLNVEETAVYLGVSKALLNKQRSKGPGINNEKKLPFTKIGDCVRYDREELDRYLEKNKQVIA